MAESIIVSIAGEIISNLVPQALEKIGKLWGIKHDLEMLSAIVSRVQVVLDSAEEQYYQSEEIKVWHNKMKDALYDAQDVLEEFNIEAMRRELRGHNEMMKEVRTFFPNSNQLAFKLKMSYKVRAVREKIEAINADRERIEAINVGRCPLGERPVNLREEQRKRRETHSFIHEEDIIGRDGDKKTIMEFLLDSNMNENVSILPIVGIGGLGKTALAKFVFNDKAVSKQFNLKMWVCVSDDFDMEKIMKNIIAGAGKKPPVEVAMEQLQSELRGAIGEKTYLLVLDDLWSIELETWKNLKSLLVECAKGSKILITTRFPSMGNIAGTTLPLFLESLSESASLELLMQIACCKEEEKQDPDMLAIGKDIVRKCSRVPLAIRTIGSLLFKKSKHEWRHFKENELPYVSRRKDDIMSILKLSYDYLPSHLKQCFAVCSLFPKDYKLKKQTLVDLWMAEGFIRPSDRRQHLEDIAHGYFMDLLGSNFFQEFQEDVGTCKMHDLMHDLACTVAGTDCLVAWDGKKSIHERTHHISYDFTSNLIGELPISCLKASALRTFLSVARYEIYGMKRTSESNLRISEANLRQLIQRFKRLRILDLDATNIEKVPRSIYKLKFLTYLDLSYNDALKRLPNSITGLHNLQTLNLYCCESLEELPRGIGKLVSLRNLDIDGCCSLSYMPCGLGQLSSLHKLSRFILPERKALANKYCGLGELSRLNNIRGKLSIENLESVIYTVEESQALREKRFLEVLYLSWNFFNITDEALLDGLRPPDNLQKLIIEGYNGESFPRWMAELPNLVELKLMRCNRCKHFPQGLSKLKHLHISEMDSLEYMPGECLGSLTSLEYLEINCLPRLTSLPLSLWHLSKLVDLKIWGCEELDLSKDESGNVILDFHGLQSLQSVYFWNIPKLESLPQSILHARSLETLDIIGCNNFKELSEQIEKCEEVDLSKDKSGNILDFHGGLPRLRYVRFDNLPKLTSLPQWLLQASNLKDLDISCCYNLKEIPEQIEALQSLQYLKINQCSSLTSFPEAMRKLTSLTHLRIYFCEELGEICERKAGKDWDKIAHIPNIDSMTDLDLSMWDLVS